MAEICVMIRSLGPSKVQSFPRGGSGIPGLFIHGKYPFIDGYIFFVGFVVSVRFVVEEN